MARGLQASVEGLKQAETAFKLKGWTQEYLAGGASCSRQTVINFFARRIVEKRFFQAICAELELEWGHIAELEPEEQPPPQQELDELVKTIRTKTYNNIQRRCGTMRVLDMEQPISLNSIYTKVNILEKISRNQRRTIAELLEVCNLKDFDRFTLSCVFQKRVPGLKAVQQHDKLMMLGKPGAGKTTFLKWLAVQCNEGRLHPDRVPVFVTLKEFAEAAEQPSLQGFISNQFQSCGIDNTEHIAKTMLQEGRALVLLDGLDEVRAVDHDRILQEICDIATQFDASQFVITCRIAAREYTFQQFTEVEVADFDDEQIAEFSDKWFQKKDPVKAEQFPKELKTHKRLKELATNPLLLTLLCLVFEEQAGFPANRAELYKEGLDILLKKWDAKRNIKRDEVYKDLSLKRKEDLLSQIGFTTFERSEYFFKQKAVEKQIEQYIRNLPNAKLSAKALQLDSEVVLKSIEAQHGLLVERARGIYSFSHLTFHEYFTALRLKERPSNQTFKTLAQNINKKRWREVFILTLEMLESADSLILLMKNEIDNLLFEDEELQSMLIEIDNISLLEQDYTSSNHLRIFYFGYKFCYENHKLARLSRLIIDQLKVINESIKKEYGKFCAIQNAINLFHGLSEWLYSHIINNNPLFEVNKDKGNLDAFLWKKVKELKEQLPPPYFNWNKKEIHPNMNWKNFKNWWDTDGILWRNNLESIMEIYSNIGYDKKLDEQKWSLIREYYDSNKLLVECLNSDCYVSREVRQEIEDSLLLSISEIEQRFPTQRH